MNLGLISLILLLAEFGEKNERHIVSVFKMIQDLLEPVWEKQSIKKTAPKSGFKALMERLPDEHKAKWPAAANASMHAAAIGSTFVVSPV